MTPLRVIAALLCATLLTACARYSVAPKPSEALLTPCVDPVIPDGSTDNDYATLMLNLGQAYINCKNEKATLATWVRGLAK